MKPRPWVVPKRKRKVSGRPRRGPGGLAVRSLPTRTIRAEPETLRLLDAACAITGRPGYDVLSRAIIAYIATLPAEAQTAIGQLAKVR